MRNVLVVIRDEVLRKRVERVFRRCGLDVDTLSPGGRLRDLLQCPVDLLVADMNAACEDGIEVVRVVKRQNPRACAVAISGSSLFATAGYQGWVHQLGVDLLLHLPFDDEILERFALVLLQANDEQAELLQTRQLAHSV